MTTFVIRKDKARPSTPWMARVLDTSGAEHDVWRKWAWDFKTKGGLVRHIHAISPKPSIIRGRDS